MLQAEPGAVVCRTAPSFLRFGSLELPSSRGDIELFTALVEYTIKNWYPDVNAVESTSQRHEAFVTAVASRTASLVAQWQSFGFTHGVMNTDNMSLLGLTMDYGPYGFMEM